LLLEAAFVFALEYLRLDFCRFRDHLGVSGSSCSSERETRRIETSITHSTTSRAFESTPTMLENEFSQMKLEEASEPVLPPELFPLIARHARRFAFEKDFGGTALREQRDSRSLHSGFNE
jgi:hypothetical protein